MHEQEAHLEKAGCFVERSDGICIVNAGWVGGNFFSDPDQRYNDAVRCKSPPENLTDESFYT